METDIENINVVVFDPINATPYNAIVTLWYYKPHNSIETELLSFDWPPEHHRAGQFEKDARRQAIESFRMR